MHVRGEEGDQWVMCPHRKSQVDAEGMSKWTLSSKGTYEVFLPVDSGMAVAYQVQVRISKFSIDVY